MYIEILIRSFGHFSVPVDAMRSCTWTRAVQYRIVRRLLLTSSAQNPLEPPVLGPITGAFPLAPEAAVTITKKHPDSPLDSLWVFNNLLKKFCKTLCCIGLGVLLRIGDVSAPVLAHHLRPPSISASARLTLGSENNDAPKGPARPTAGAVLARRAFSS